MLHLLQQGDKHMRPEELYLTIINNLCDGVYLVNNERRITFWNKAAEEITGYAHEEIVGQNCQSNMLNHIDKDGRPLCLLECPLYATMFDGKQRKEEVFLRHKEGHRVPVLVNIFPILEEGGITGAIEIFTPNSPTVYDDDLIERLCDMAMNDQLTGLANRRKLESYLEYKFHEMKRFQNGFCLIFLDIDNFSAFNNTYGHEVGDMVLKSVTKSIKHSMRKSDMLGRWGGEEFVGVFDVRNDGEAIMLAEKIRMLVAGSHIPYEGEDLSVTVSLGVTLACDGDTLESIVNRADALMYESKQDGKNRVTTDIRVAEGHPVATGV